MSKKKSVVQRYGPRLTKLYKELIPRRDQYQCQKCKVNLRRGGRHIHHIRERSKSILMFWDLMNLILFCRDCHCWAGHDPVGVDAWLKKHFPHLYKYQHEVIECPKTGRMMPRRNCLKSWTAKELKDMIEDYKSQLQNWHDIENL